MSVSIQKYPKQPAELFPGGYVGIATGDLNTEGTAYLPEYGACHNNTSDVSFEIFTCAGARRTEILFASMMTATAQSC